MTRAEAMREVAVKMRDVAREMPDDPQCAADFVGWAMRLEDAAGTYEPAVRRPTLVLVDRLGR